MPCALHASAPAFIAERQGLRPGTIASWIDLAGSSYLDQALADNRDRSATQGTSNARTATDAALSAGIGCGTAPPTENGTTVGSRPSMLGGNGSVLTTRI